jgi:hypothetical protein
MLTVQTAKGDSTHKSVFVFQTHVLNHYVRERLEQIIQQVSGTCDVYVLIPGPNDISKGCLHKFFDGLDVGVVTYDMYDIYEATYGYRYENRRKVFYISEHLPFVYFFETFPNYEYLWRSEYDVLFTGDWSHFINHFSETNSDFIATNIYSFYGSEPHWNHWWRARSQEDFWDNPIEQKDMVRSSNGVFGMSKELSRVLRDNVLNFKAHYEVVIATIANKFDLSIRDIGGYGSYTSNCDKGKFYFSAQSELPGVDSSVGTFGTSGNFIGLDSYLPNFFYHPVKSHEYTM